MVDTETTTTEIDLNRLITFDIDSDEMLYIAAGRGEMDNRIIYNDSSSGRYAVVPVDELHARAGIDSGDDIDLDLGGSG